ncbi:hypothetical protein GGR32_002218 [Mesonia hippocampi]|uniref:Uncharacterized protein n=1 Tax=Mesonia hippocampi TaxID=1628250 RepID=A0A840EWG3_9FLAO|nr:hypothetical protein [Mesonia hippocampi]MBB4119906.1 hypothetical protein [Mesonia hippocampi]
MTLYEFIRLPESDQYHVAFTRGVFITYHLEAEKRYALYAIDKFFIEVTYAVEANKLLAIKSFKTGKLLDKYSNFDKGKI